MYVPADNPLKGPLIYVGEGELKDFNGKKVEGSIVLMNFNTGKNWINAMKLGAKAVIFIAPSSTSFYEARAKILQTPVHFPRVYVSQKIGSILKGLANSGTEVSLSLNMKYEEVNAKNIIAVVPGSERPNDIIVIAAHYDTWSVVPALAPGADEAVSVSSLMELARYFSKHQPKLTIWFVALAGHWEALAGAREFVETFYFNESVLSGDQKIWAFMALDISTDLTKAALLYTGFFYEFYGGTITATDARFTRWLRPEVFNVILPALQQQTGRNYELENGFLSQWGWWASIYGPYMLDSEPFCIAHGLGFAFRTSSSRTRWGHPLTGIEQVSLSNLAPQLEMASAILYYLSEFGVKMDWYTLKPARTLYTAGGADVAGYITLPGKVMIYNVSRGWYDPMPNAIVAVLRGGSLGYSSYPFSKILVKADENGTFEVHGIGGVFAVSHSGWLGAGIFIEAYVIDDKTGLIEYAPDLGQWGAMRIPFLRNPDRHPFPVTTVVFKASSIVIFDISDPTVIAPYDIEDRLLYNHEELRYFGSEKEDYPADLNTAWLELKTYLEADYDWPFASLTNPGEASSLVDLILTFDGATPDCHADVLAYLGVIENVDPDIAIDITEIPYIQTWITTTQLWFDFALVGEYTSGAVAPIDPSEAVAETKINWTGDTWNYRGWYRYVPQHIWRVYLTIQEEIDIITSWTSSYDYIIFNDQTFRDALRFYENVEQSSTTLLGDLDPRDKVLVLKDFFESLESGSVYAFTDTSSDDSLETVNEDHQGFFTPTYSGTNLNVPAVISATHLKIDDTYEYNYVLPNGETETRTGIELDTVRGWIKCKYIVESSDPDFKAYDAGASSNSMDTRVRGIDYSDSMYLRYVINTTKNFADMNDLNSQFVGITEAGIYNTEDKLIAYAHFPPVIYDSYVNHLAINWYISDTDFAYP